MTFYIKGFLSGIKKTLNWIPTALNQHFSANCNIILIKNAKKNGPNIICLSFFLHKWQLSFCFETSNCINPLVTGMDTNIFLRLWH